MATRSKLAVILHADVVGSTALVQFDERIAHERIQDAFHRLSDTVAAYAGTTRELRGDALLAEFERASDAVSAALVFQAANRAHNEKLVDPVRPEVRVGIALGEVVIADNTITGAGVVLAQRLEQMAPPGGVCVSAAVREAVPVRLPVEFEELGRRTAKGFEELVLAFSVSPQRDAELLRPEPRVAGLRSRSAQRAIVAGAAATALLAAGLMAWLGPWKSEETTARLEPPIATIPDKPSIAVLPFDNLSEGTEQDYFADGLTDDLITDLSKVSGLLVIARNSTFRFKGQPVEATHVARELGVRYVVEGSVRRADDRVRVNAQLVDTITGHHVWAERYDRELVDLFATQDELARRIVSALAVRLTQAEHTELADRPAPAFEAYDLYLRARSGHLSQDEGRMAQSLALYERAWSIDPTFARPYGGYARLAADIWRSGGVRGALGASGALARATAEAAAKRALSLDPTLPEAHAAIALMRMKDAEHEAALDAARRAVSYQPNDVDAYTVLAIVEGFAGRLDAALDSIRTAVRLDPRPPPYLSTYYGWVLFLNRRYDEAIAVLAPIADSKDRGLGESPREFLAMAYARAGRLEEARAQVESLHLREPFLNLAYYRVAYGHYARVEDLEHHLDALAQAGMPAWPLGFRDDPDQRLTGAELRSLASGMTWRGEDAGRALEFIQEFSGDGGTVYMSATTLLSGAAVVENDALCESFEGFLWGQPLCGFVYRHAAGSPGERNEYVYVNPATLRYFSPGS